MFFSTDSAKVKEIIIKHLVYILELYEFKQRYKLVYTKIALEIKTYCQIKNFRIVKMKAKSLHLPSYFLNCQIEVRIFCLRIVKKATSYSDEFGLSNQV